MKTWFIYAIKIILLVFLTAIAAQVTVQVPTGSENIPISAQSLVIMVCCIFLSSQEALLAMLIYLVVGALGFPVFADGASGVEKLRGGSAGFLFGFAIVGQLIAVLGSYGFRSSYIKALAAMFIATAVLLLCGNLVLVYKYGLSKGLEYGFYPFWKGAIIKAIIGAALIVILELTLNKKKPGIEIDPGS